MSQLVRFDWAIKHLLRHKANFDILEGFLSELLKTPIKIENVLESESNKNHARDKFNRVDLLVKTDTNEKIIVEVQCSHQSDYLSRILYGTSKVVCEQIREGDAYSKICKVISISIVFFNLGEGKDYLYKGYTSFKGMHCGDILGLKPQEKAVYEAIHLTQPQLPEHIFPEYYIIKVSQFHDRVQDKIDEWIYFLKRGEVKQEFSAQGIQSAAQKLNMLQLSEQERRAYACYQEDLHDEGSFDLMLEVSKKEGIKEGRQKGREEGRKEGRQEGRKEGREEGREEERHRLVRSLRQAGLSDQQIALHTGLPVEKIQHYAN
jgi:predicted transposase/invertase (TIGR01784 family)